eukprot:scaffold151019_cov47-Prasinocladus_malaysianus.AAC.1
MSPGSPLKQPQVNEELAMRKRGFKGFLETRGAELARTGPFEECPTDQVIALSHARQGVSSILCPAICGSPDRASVLQGALCRRLDQRIAGPIGHLFAFDTLLRAPP